MKIIKYFIFIMILSSSLYANDNKELLKACKKGNLNKVQILLSKGADINITDGITGENVLHIASDEGHIDIVKYLIEIKKMNINSETKGYGYSPLYLAASNNKLPIVKYLIEKGADVNYKNRYSFTPICEAAAKGYIEVVKYLIEHKANLNIISTFGETPLFWAVRGYRKKVNLDTVKYLVENGAEINIKNKKGETPISISTNEVKRYLESKVK